MSPRWWGLVGTIVTAIAFGGCGASPAATTVPSAPSAASASGARAPGARIAGVDSIMAAWNRRDSPGCAVAVVQAGQIVHARGYGMADLEHGVPITPDTVFDIASVSKQFTAASIFLLAADGALGLDDDIRKYVTDLPALGKAITIRHLLHHMSGLRDYTTLLVLGGWRFDDVTTPADALAALARQKALAFEPGSQHRYSNSGYFLLAQIVERAGKTTMARFARDRIFTPLGMTRTHVHDDHTLIVPGRAVGYSPGPDGTWRIDMSGWEQTGDGAVMTTVLDLARWDANFESGRVGGRSMIDGLVRRGTLASGKALDYAAGLSHGEHRGLATISHGGAWAGYRAYYQRFPGQRTSVIVLCNAGSADQAELARKISDVVLARQLRPASADTAPPRPAALSAAELDAWVGTYREDATGAIAAVVRTERGALALEAAGGRFDLQPTSKRTFKLHGLDVTAEFAGAAPARRLALRGRSFEETYAEAILHTPSAAELAAYAGRYRSAELATEWTLAVQRGRMVLRGRNVEDTLVAGIADEFAAVEVGVTLRFTRDRRAITGFVASAGDVRITFEKLGNRGAPGRAPRE